VHRKVILLYFLLRKTAFKEMQNMIHLNLSLALLLGLIVFVSGIETASDNKVSILATTDSIHTVLANPYEK